MKARCIFLAMGIFALVALLFVVTEDAEAVSNYANINIDGDDTDWNAVPISVTDPSGDGGIIDYHNGKMANDENYFYSHAYLDGFGSDKEVVYFDTDLNPGSGYPINGIGADFKFETEPFGAMGLSIWTGSWTHLPAADAGYSKTSGFNDSFELRINWLEFGGQMPMNVLYAHEWNDDLMPDFGAVFYEPAGPQSDPLDEFRFDTPHDIVYQGQPFDVTVTAIDTTGLIKTDYTGPVNIFSNNPDYIINGETGWIMGVNTYTITMNEYGDNYMVTVEDAPVINQTFRDVWIVNGPVQNVNTGKYYNFIDDALVDPLTQSYDTITVNPGTYNEYLEVHQPINLIGTDPATTIIQGTGTGILVDIDVWFVNIDGFTIRDGGTGIKASMNSQFITITNCQCIWNTNNGIDITDCANVSIGNTVCSNNGFDGVTFYQSDYNHIFNCTFEDNDYAGVSFFYSGENTVCYCDFEGNFIGIYMIDNSNGNVVYRNNFGTQASYLCYDDSTTVNNNTWNLPIPIGGNYWVDHTGPDADNDGFVDAARWVYGGNSYDYLPFTEPSGWENQPPTMGDWVVDSNMTYQNQTIIIDGDVIINEGTTVKLLNVVLVCNNIVIQNDSSLDTDPTYIYTNGNIWVDGNFVLDDTILTMNNSYDGSANIYVNSTGILNIRNGSMIRSNGTFQYMIMVSDGAVLMIENSTVKNCGWNDMYPGLLIETSNIHLYNSTFTENYNGITMNSSKYGLIKYCNISNNMNIGILMTSYSQFATLTSNNYDDKAPFISERNIAWAGEMEHPDHDNEIWYFNETSGLLRLTYNDWDDWDVQISGCNVSWMSSHTTFNEIHFWNGTLHEDIVTGMGIHDMEMDDSLIAWRDGSSDIQYWDGSTHQLTTTGDCWYPKVSNGEIVWYWDDGDGDEIMLWDGSTITQITNNGLQDNFPYLSDGHIYWRNWDGIKVDLHYWNGSSITQITNNTENELIHDIDGENIVFTTFVDPLNKLYYWDGTSIVNIRSTINQLAAARVSNGQVVWIEKLDGVTFNAMLWDGSTICRLSPEWSMSPDIENWMLAFEDHDGNDYEIKMWNGGPVTGENVIAENLIMNNMWGIKAEFCHQNLFYHNAFINNPLPAFDDGWNDWNLGYDDGGNYWDTWNTPDLDKDGYVDTPCAISGGTNQDQYPWVIPDGWNTLEFPVTNQNKGTRHMSLQAAIDSADPGDTLIIEDRTYEEDLFITQDLKLEDSKFVLDGNLVIAPSGDLEIENGSIETGNVKVEMGGELSLNDSPNTLISNNVWVDGVLYINASTWTVDNTYDGEYGIQVNSTGQLIIQDGSLITSSNTNFEYTITVDDGAVFRLENSTIRDCGYSGIFPGLWVDADNAYIYNATLRDNYIGVLFNSSGNSRIIDTYFTNNVNIAMRFQNECHHNMVRGSTVFDNSNGIYIGTGSHNNTIQGNHFNQNWNWGASLTSSSTHNVFLYNNFSNNFFYGILANSCVNNIIDNNTFWSNNDKGIVFTDGIDKTRVSNNTFYNNPNCQLEMSFSDWNVIENNEFHFSLRGISSDTCIETRIRGNSITNNMWGLWITNSNNDRIFNNNFIGNTYHANCSTMASWNEPLPTGGNYWDTWTSPDVAPVDGFVDIPYMVPGGGGGQDNWPYTAESGWRDAQQFIFVNKSVFNISSGMWEDYVYTPYDSVSHWRIQIHNDGPDDLEWINITDFLPESLMYEAGSAMVDGIPQEPEIKWGLSTELYWNLTGPFPYCTWINIEFDLRKVLSGVDVNHANITARIMPEGYVYGDDDATAWSQTVFMEKTVWNDTSGMWEDHIYSTLGSIERFNLTVHNDGPYPLMWLNVSDWLPQSLAYMPGSAFVNGIPWEPDWISSDGSTLSWNFTGPIPYCTWYYIEFDVEVVSEGVDINWMDITARNEIGETIYGDGDNATIEKKEEEVYIFVNKSVYNRTSGLWEEIIESEVGFIETFRIQFHSLVFPWDVIQVNVTDYLPESLDYVPGSAIVDGVPQEPDWIRPDGKILSWNISGWWPYCTWMNITFDVEVVSTGFDVNEVNITAWAEGPGYAYYGEDNATIFKEPTADWLYKSSYPNYAPSGMPDFDQRQNPGWMSIEAGLNGFLESAPMGDDMITPNGLSIAPGPNNNLETVPMGDDVVEYCYCGPTAAANCLWWFDSKYGDPTGTPGDGLDEFDMVMDYGPGDDHLPANVPFLIEDLASMFATNIRAGTDPYNMTIGLNMWLQMKDLDSMLYVHNESWPDFEFVATEIERCQDVMLFIGFYSEEGQRTGGHIVTSAGVNRNNMQIAISDPIKDIANPTGNYLLHNNASIVSHDIYNATMGAPVPGIPPHAWYLSSFTSGYGYPQQPPVYYGIVEHAVLLSPQPNMSVEKTVWNTTSGMWEDVIYAELNETVRVNITITNIGGYELWDLNVTDLLPESLEYAGSCTVNGTDTIPFHITPDYVTWMLWMALMPGDSVYIEFDVNVTMEGVDVNWAYVEAWVPDMDMTPIYGFDNATVIKPYTGPLGSVYNEDLDLWYDNLTAAMDEVQILNTLILYDDIYEESVIAPTPMFIEVNQGKAMIRGTIPDYALYALANGVWVENLIITNPGGYGARVNPGGQIGLTNCDVYGCEYGVWMEDSVAGYLENCHIFDNTEAGVYLLDCTYSNIENNMIYANKVGLVDENGYLNEIIFNDFVMNEGNALLLDSCTQNTLWSNAFVKNAWSLMVKGTGTDYNHTVANNNTVNGQAIEYRYGITSVSDGGFTAGLLFIAGCDHLDFASLNITYGDGVYVVESDYLNFTSSNFEHNSVGIGLKDVVYCQISTDCYIEWNGVGVLAKDTEKLYINMVELYNNSIGISASTCDKVHPHSNNFVDNGVGIQFSDILNSSIYWNIFMRDTTAISMSDSNSSLHSNEMNEVGKPMLLNSCSGTSVTNTMMQLCGSGISVSGEYDVTVATSNTFNGQPVYYFYDVNNASLSLVDVGQLIVVGCDNMSFALLTLDNAAGIEVLESWAIEIVDTSMENASTLSLERSYDCVLDNVFILNSGGILISEYSAGNLVQDCEISGCGAGLTLSSYAANTTIIDCDLYDNGVGVLLDTTAMNYFEGVDAYDNIYGYKLSDAVMNMVVDSAITGNDYGFYVEDSFGNIVEDSNIYGNAIYGAHAEGNDPNDFNAQNNYWGGANGPYHPGTNPAGDGDNVTDLVDYSGYLGAVIPMSVSIKLKQIPGVIGEFDELITGIELQGISSTFVTWTVEGADWLDVTDGKLVGQPRHDDVGGHVVALTAMDAHGQGAKTVITMDVIPHDDLVAIEFAGDGSFEIVEGWSSLGFSNGIIIDRMDNGYVELTPQGAVFYIYEPGTLSYIATSGNYELTISRFHSGTEQVISMDGHADRVTSHKYVVDWDAGEYTKSIDRDMDGLYEEVQVVEFAPATASAGFPYWLLGLSVIALLGAAFVLYRRRH